MEGLSSNVGVANPGYSIKNANDYAPIYGTIYFVGSGVSRDLKVNGVQAMIETARMRRSIDISSEIPLLLFPARSFNVLHFIIRFE
jgi:hypothetical protein